MNPKSSIAWRRLAKLAAIAGIMLLSTALAGAEESQAGLELTATPEVPGAVCATGEEFSFLVTLKSGGKPLTDAVVICTLKTPGEAESKSEHRIPPEGLRISRKSSKPGFVLLIVQVKSNEGKLLERRAGIGISTNQIVFPSTHAPADFAAFWDGIAAECRAMPIAVQRTPCAPAPHDRVDSWDIQVNCPGGTPVSGYLAIPRRAAAHSLPARIFFHGAGVRSAHLDMAKSIAAGQNLICLDINAHGLPNGKDEEFYRTLAKGALKDYAHQGADDPQTSYFLGMFRRVLRGVIYLTTLPEWDGRTLIASGASQGGGQALFAAAMLPEITLVTAGVPALCGHSAYRDGYPCGWPRWVSAKNMGKADQKEIAAAAYYDMINFTPRIRAEAVFTVGFIDPVCPPDTVYAAYNATGSKNKQMLNGPGISHNGSKEWNVLVDRIIAQHIAQRGSKDSSEGEKK